MRTHIFPHLLCGCFVVSCYDRVSIEIPKNDASEPNKTIHVSFAEETSDGTEVEFISGFFSIHRFENVSPANDSYSSALHSSGACTNIENKKANFFLRPSGRATLLAMKLRSGWKSVKLNYLRQYAFGEIKSLRWCDAMRVVVEGGGEKVEVLLAIFQARRHVISWLSRQCSRKIFSNKFEFHSKFFFSENRFLSLFINNPHSAINSHHNVRHGNFHNFRLSFFSTFSVFPLFHFFPFKCSRREFGVNRKLSIFVSNSRFSHFAYLPLQQIGFSSV